jgi:hypothetical protein
MQTSLDRILEEHKIMATDVYAVSHIEFKFKVRDMCTKLFKAAARCSEALAVMSKPTSIECNKL